MPLEFLLMAFVFLAFALLAQVGIQLNFEVFNLLQLHSEDGYRHISQYLIVVILLYCAYLAFSNFKIIVYERFFIQFGAFLDFEKRVKFKLHNKCADIDLLSYEKPNIHKFIYEAQVASMNVFRIVQILLSGVALMVGFLAIGAYFVRLDWRYILLLALSSFPTLAEKIVKASQELKKREKISLLERKNVLLFDSLMKPSYFTENKLLGIHSFLFHRWKKVQDEIISILISIHFKYFKIESLAAIITFLGNAGAFSLALYFLRQNGNLGQFTSTLAAFQVLSGFVRELADLQGHLIMFSSMVKPYFELMELPQKNNESVQVNKLTKGIELRDVSFKYPNGKDYALKNINMDIKKGETVALVGLNGAGKTTLSKLLLNLYNPTTGNTYVDGNEVHPDSSLHSIFRFESAIFQDFCKYPVSVLDNVTISDSPNNYSRAKVILAKCGISENTLDYNLLLGRELGNRDISGGQWQRLAIARGIYRDSDFMLLDEPTSEIDPLQEHELYQLFREITKGKTAVIVTHRLGSIKFVDRIIVLADGKIVESGTHNELIKKDGLYCKMWKTQAANYM